MLTCGQTRKHLSNLLDGQCTGLRRWWVKGHLLICPACRRTKQSLENTVGLLKDLAGDSPDTPPTEEI